MCEKMNGYILKNARVIDPGRNIDSVGDIAVQDAETGSGAVDDRSDSDADTGHLGKQGRKDHVRQVGRKTETV